MDINTLVSLGWSLKDELWRDLESAQGETLLQDAALNIDLRKAGKAALPDDISKSDARLIKGPHVLQIVACDDVAHPSRGVSGSPKGRMLRLKLTDGKTTCKAVEMRPLPDMSIEELPPGTKVLGGRVEELYEAWEFQRKYGAGAARPAADAAGAADSERPPPFQTYVPGKTRAPRRPAAAPGLAGPDVHAVPAAPAAVAAQRDGGAAAGRPPGIAPPPGFNLIPDRLRFERNAAPAAVRGPSSDPVSARQGELGSLGEVAAAEALPSRAGPSAAAKAKLQERLAASEEVSRGRGGQRGRGRRRGRFHDEEEESGMTLDEWEAQQRSKAAGGRGVSQAGGSQGQVLSDEELARQLQRQLDMEDSLQQDQYFVQQPRSAVDDLKASLFAYERPDEDSGYRGRGRRGRRRGG